MLSSQLFEGEPYIIETAVEIPFNGTAEEQHLPPLIEIFQQMNNVISVNHKDGQFQISCSSDLSAVIARPITIKPSEKNRTLITIRAETNLELIT